jgi:hypothetical protein
MEGVIFLMSTWGGYLPHNLFPPVTEVANEIRWKHGEKEGNKAVAAGNRVKSY